MNAVNTIDTGSVRSHEQRLSRTGTMRVASKHRPLHLESGDCLDDASLAYEVFGPLYTDSVVLICHALTGDAHVTRQNAEDRPGWWETLVGPGKAIDTERYTVICSNVLGGCSGSTGPTSPMPSSGQPFGPSFPRVTIGDMVEAQRRLVDALGYTRGITVIGGSIGGFQALEWVRRFPHKIAAAAVIAAGTSLSPFGIAFNTIGRKVIRSDPNFRGGRYTQDLPPADGLAAARQLAHLTYRTSSAFDKRFGRRTVQARHPDALAGDRFEVQSYLDYKGQSFAKRFDANTYITLTEAMDAYDADRDGGLTDRMAECKGQLLSVGYSSDWLFAPEQSLLLAAIAERAGVCSRGIVLETDDGHDAFLMPHEGLSQAVRRLLDDAECP